MTKLDQAKKCAKEHGVKGFRKLRLKKEVYIVGKQCARIEKHIALRLIVRLEQFGFKIGSKETTLELAKKGLLDTITLESC